MRPLLVPVPLHDGESLQGLASRAQLANHYDSVGITLGVSIATKSAQQLLHECNRGDFSAEKLAMLTHNPVSAIEKAQLRLAPPVVGRETDQYLVPHRWRLCPECFGDTAFHRRLWSLTCVTACPVHGKELIDACGDCGAPLELGCRLGSDCPKCGVRLSAGKRASTSALELATAADSALAAHTAGNPAPLAALHTRFATAVMLTDPKYLAVRSRISPQLMDLQQIASLVDRFGHIAASDQALGAYAARVVGELARRWKHLPGAATVTVKRIADIAGADLPETMQPLLNSSGFGVSCDVADTLFLVSPSKWVVPSETAAAVLGVSRFVLLRLLKTGLVDNRLRSEEKSKNGGLVLVSLDSLQALMERLHHLATEAPTMTDGPLTRLWDHKVEEAIPAILSGSMAIYRGDGDAINAFRVRYQETQHGQQRRTIPEGLVTVEQAAKRLMTYRAVIDRLMDIGRLSTVRWHGGHVRLIEIESLEAFDREYVFVGTLAKQHGVNSTNLSEKLQAFGVYAVMGPDIDGGLVRAFRRPDLIEINFEAVKGLKWYETKAGRKKKQATGDPSN